MKQRTMRKLLSWALVLSMLLSVLPTAALAIEVGAIAETTSLMGAVESAETVESEKDFAEEDVASLSEDSAVLFADFAGGNGTEESPYMIADATQLNNVRNYLDSCFEVIADIEFTFADFAEGGAFYNGGAGR